MRWFRRKPQEVDIQRLDGNEVLVIRSDRELTADQMHRLRVQWDAAIRNPAARTIVLPPGFRIEAAVKRPEGNPE